LREEEHPMNVLCQCIVMEQLTIRYSCHPLQQELILHPLLRSLAVATVNTQ
jgi:hypothetical protein